MAKGKRYPLTIAIQTVDRATAGLKRINDRLNRISAPVRRLRGGLVSLARESGLPRIANGFRDVGREAGRLATRVGLIAGAAGLGVAGLKRMVDAQDNLAKRADRLGLTIDTYAQLRFAAGQSGTEMARFDSAMEGFSKRVGEAKAGTGSLVTLLKKVSPALLKQVQAAESNEEAFNLMAAAIAKLEDPSKRAALASAAFGRSGQSLLNLFNQGPEGLAKLRQEYFELAGSQEESARKSELMADAMGRIDAASSGVKAALLSGLAPALLEIADKAKQFFVDNRDDIAAWAEEFGKKLPARIAVLMGWLKKLGSGISSVVDFLGGARNAAILLAAFMSRGLIAAIVKLGIAFAATPFGLVVTAIAAIIAAGALLVRHWDDVKAFFVLLWDTIKGAFLRFFNWVKNIFLDYTPMGRIIKHWEPISGFFERMWEAVKKPFKLAWEFISGIVEKVTGAADKVKNAAVGVFDAITGREEIGIRGFVDRQRARAQTRDRQRAELGRGQIDINLNGAPRGTRTEANTGGLGLGVNLSTGYQLELP